MISMTLPKANKNGFTYLYFIAKTGSKFTSYFKPVYKPLLTMTIDTKMINASKPVTCGLRFTEGSRSDDQKILEFNSGGGVCKLNRNVGNSKKDRLIFNKKVLYYTGTIKDTPAMTTGDKSKEEELKLRNYLPQFAITDGGPMDVVVKSSTMWKLRHIEGIKRAFVVAKDRKLTFRPDFTYPGGRPAPGSGIIGQARYLKIKDNDLHMINGGDELKGDFASIKFTPVKNNGKSMGKKEIEFNRSDSLVSHNKKHFGFLMGIQKTLDLEPNQLLKVEFDAPKKFLGRDLTIGYLGYVGKPEANKKRRCVLDIRKNSMWSIVDKRRIGQALTHYAIAQQVRVSEISSIDKRPYLNLTVSLRGSDKGCRFIPKNNLATIVRPHDDKTFKDGIKLVIHPDSFDVSEELGLRHVLSNGRINSDYFKGKSVKLSNLVSAYLDISDEYHKGKYGNKPFMRSYKLAAKDRVDIGFITKGGAWEPGKKLSAPIPEVVIDRSNYEYFVTVTVPEGSKFIKRIPDPANPGKFKLVKNMPNFNPRCELKLRKGKGWDEEMGQIIIEKRGGCIVTPRKRGVEMYYEQADGSLDSNKGKIEPIIKVVDMDKMSDSNT